MPANDKDRREARLAAALKENLKRRKLQAKEKVEEREAVLPARDPDTAPQAGREIKPRLEQKSAPKPR